MCVVLIWTMSPCSRSTGSKTLWRHFELGFVEEIQEIRLSIHTYMVKVYYIAEYLLLSTTKKLTQALCEEKFINYITSRNCE